MKVVGQDWSHGVFYDFGPGGDQGSEEGRTGKGSGNLGVRPVFRAAFFLRGGLGAGGDQKTADRRRACHSQRMFSGQNARVHQGNHMTDRALTGLPEG